MFVCWLVGIQLQTVSIVGKKSLVVRGGEEKKDKLSDRIYRLWEKRAWLLQVVMSKRRIGLG